MKRLLFVLVSAVAVVMFCVLPAIGIPPGFALTTQPVTNIGYNTATFSTVVNAEILGKNSIGGNNVEHAAIMNSGAYISTSVYFLYGTSPVSLVYQTPTQNAGGSTTVTYNVTGLQPGTTYYVEAVAVANLGTGYNSSPAGFLTALLYPTLHTGNVRSAGIGLQITPVTLVNQKITGNVVSFTTLIPSSPKVGQGGGGGSATQTASISNITVQSAAISASTVSPGEKVTVTSNLINSGNAEGTAKVTLYVNGQEEESKGVNVAAGQSTPVTFTLSQSEPGTYNVYVNSVSAGSFTVDLFKDNTTLIYVIIAVITLAIVGVLFFIVRKPVRSR